MLLDQGGQRAYQKFVELADKKKLIYDDDLISIARDEMTEVADTGYSLDYLCVSAGTGTVPTATVRLRHQGKVIQDAACGDGPVDAALKTIDRITGRPGRLIDFSLQAVSVGQDAMGEVSIRVEFGPETISAKAASTDIVDAAAKAYLACVNRLISRAQPPPAGARRKK